MGRGECRLYLLLYRVLISLGVPILAVWALVRRLSGRGPSGMLGARLSAGPAGDGQRTLWIHGASNGELASARSLIARLRGMYPGWHFLVTTNTDTARAMVADWDLPDTEARLAPLDLLWLARALIRRRNVAALLVIENEFWPNRLLAAEAEDVPVIVIGARISARSAARWRRVAPLARRVLATVRLLSAQDSDSQDRFAALGLSAARTAPRLDLKALYVPVAEPDGAPALPDWDRARTVLAAATHPGEEEVVLVSFEALRKRFPALRLILAPRHPGRAASLVERVGAAGFSVARRSLGEKPGADTAVYLADTMGEMPLWYRAAAVTFVGGSLVPLGGHTPFEPAAYGTAILHGPHVSNFARIYGRLDAAGGAVAVATADDMAEAVQDLLRDGRAGRVAARAAEVMAGRGDAAPLLERIAAILGQR